MYMLKSPEGITFNHVDLQERFTDADNALYDYFMVNDVAGRGVNGKEIELITVSNNDGAYVEGGRKPPRYLDVTITVKSPSFSDLRRKIDELNDILNTREDAPIVFDDEVDMTYYGRLDSVNNLTEEHKIYQAVLTFLCSDPYKYGPEVAKDLGDIDTVNNEGTAPADPIFELTAKEKTTFAMISNGADEDAEYNLIGTPADDDVEVVDARDTVYKLDGMDGWSSDGVQADSRFPKVTGTMQYDGTGMRPNNFGTGDRIHGPGVIRELDESIQNFEINAIFDVISERDIDNFRLEISFFDENMDNIGALGIKDNNRFKNLRVGLGRVGPYRGGGVENGYIIGEDNYTKENFSDNTLMHMKMKREGNEFYFQIGRWRVNRLNDVLDGTYRDIDNEFMGKLKYVQVLIGSYGDRAKPARLRINKIDVIKLTQTTVDQTPYILYPEDKVTFDHKNEDILVNGEPRNDLKNFGGSFFKLKKGYNSLIVHPSDTFGSKVIYSNKYL